MLISRIDDEIHTDFLEKLPEYKFDDALRILDEEEMKTAKGKERWRSFIMPVSLSSLSQPGIICSQDSLRIFLGRKADLAV